MDLESVETFLAIVETGTITGAAKRVRVTQATVSKRIDALEAELGYGLLERHRGMRSVALTPQGEGFEPLARQWVAIARDMGAILEGANRPQFSVATVDSVGAFALRDAFKTFACEHSEARFGIEIHHSDEVAELIERRVIDMGYAFAPAPYGDLLSKPIYRERMRVLCPCGLGRPSAVEPGELDPCHEVHLRLGEAYESWYERYWPRGRYRMYIAPASMVPDYLDGPDAWAIVPESVARDFKGRFGYEVHELTCESPSLLCYQIEPRRCPPNVARLMRALEDAARKVVSASAGLEAFEPWMLGDANTVIRM